MSSNSKKVVSDYLENNGFPFEMEVAQIFRKAGFDVYQSEIYTDPESGKSREMDITSIYSTYHNGHQFIIEIVIECKHGNTPWIAFPSQFDGYTNMNASYFYLSNISQLLNDVEFDLDEGKPIFTLVKNDLYGLTVVKSKGNTGKEEVNDSAYKAIQGVLSCTKSKYKRWTSPQLNRPVHFVTVPIVVVKGDLFSARLENDKLEVEQIEEGQLVWKEALDIAFPKIHIATNKSIKKLAATIFTHCSLLLRPENMARVVNAAVQKEKK